MIFRKNLGTRKLRLEPLEDRRMLSITLFVDDNSPSPTPNGLAWTSAYPDLQSALDRAIVLNNDDAPDNDVGSIWIAEGTYRPTAELEPGIARTASFSLLDGVALYGGFLGTETTLDERILDSAHATILSGDLGTLDDTSDNAHTVVYCGESIETTIDGVLIINGNADGYYEQDHLERIYGGGIFNSGILIITNSVLSKNSAENGGGIYNCGSLTLTDSMLSGNSAEEQGGGIYNKSTAMLMLKSSTLFDNSSDNEGGGIFNCGNLTLTNSTLVGNSATNEGGGIYNSGNSSIATLTLVNSMILGNLAISGGGIYNDGFYVGDIATLTLTNSTISGNSAYSGGGGICNRGTNWTTTLNNTIVAGNAAPNTPDINGATNLFGSYNLIGDGTSQSMLINGVNGNQVGTSSAPIDPILSSFTQLDNGQWVCYLLPDSPAINTGNNALAVDPTGQPLAKDILGNVRVSNGSVDIGAVEGAILGTPGQVYYVTSLENTIADDGILTFIEALEAANRNLPVGDAPAGSFIEQDTIRFANGVTGTILLDDGELVLYGEVNIEGPGAELLAFDATGQNRAFLIHANASVSLSGVTITGGLAEKGGGIYNKGVLTLTDSTLTGNSADSGGGIYNKNSHLTITNTKISGNFGSGLFNEASRYASAALMIINSSISDNHSGGIYNKSSELGTATLTITDSAIVGNSTGSGIYNFGHYGTTIAMIADSTIAENSADYGGGICNHAQFGTAILMLTNSTLSENSADIGGGGIFNNNITSGTATITITNSTLAGNSSGDGGGICNKYGTVTIMNSSISGSSASVGGGIGNEGTLTLTNSTLAGNLADWGGGVYNSGPLTVTNSTLSGNSAGQGGGIYNDDSVTATLNNTIVAGNVNTDIYSYFGTVVGSNNLIGNGEGQTLINGVNGNQVGTSALPINPMLSDLTQFDNGTWGYGLLSGSPAIDAGSDVMAVDSIGQNLTEDISGDARIAGSAVDIGALEGVAQSTPAQVYVVTSLEETIANDGILTFTEAFEAASRNQPVGDAAAGSFIEQDIIQFANGVNGTILLDNGELVIAGNLSIEGPGAEKLTFDAANQNRLFFILPNISVNLGGMTITGGSVQGNGGGIYNTGNLTLTDSMLSNNSASVNYCGGGGIYNYLGNLTITNSTLAGNSINANNNAGGGGIYNLYGKLTLTNSLLLNNSINGDNSSGGGIFSLNGNDLTITNSTLMGNSVSGIYSTGSGISNFGASLTLTNSILSNNVANGNHSSGAGIWNANSDHLTIINTTLAGNLVIGNNSSGGGIYSYQSNLILTNVAILGNSTTGNLSNGGGICSCDNDLTITNSTLAGNSASGYNSSGGGIYDFSGSSTLTIANSIVALNNATNDLDVHGTISDASSYNLIGNDPKFIRNPSKGADNEWGTEDDDYGDLRLRIGSLAVDSGNTSLLPADATDMDHDGNLTEPIPFDIEGAYRVQGNAVNIGAYETYYSDNRVGPILYVDEDALPGSDAFSNWECAFTDLQSALDRAAMLNSDGTLENDVDQIWIAEGTYYPTAKFEPGNARSASFNLLDSVSLYGGFVGTETTLEEREVELSTHLTVLSGNLGLVDDYTDNAYNVVFCPAQVHTTLDRVAIVDGYADDDSDENRPSKMQGAGIYSSGNLLVRDSFVCNNTALIAGGIYNDFGTLNLVNSTVEKNVASKLSGGGIYNIGGILTLTHVDLDNNIAIQNGGGLCTDMGIVTIQDCVISKNIAKEGGGGIANYNGQIRIESTTLSENQTASVGGGLLQQAGVLDVWNTTFSKNNAAYAGAIFGEYGTINITNATIVYNWASNTGGGILNAYSHFTLNNSIVASNVAPLGSDVYQHVEELPICNISGGYNLIGIGDGQTTLTNGTNGNLVGTAATPIDPKLGDEIYFPAIGYGYYLLPDSPAKNNGSNALAVDPYGIVLTTDQADAVRIQDGTVDQGALESNVSSTSGVTYVVSSLSDTIANDGILTFREAFYAATQNQSCGDALAGSWTERDTIQFAQSLTGTVELGGTPIYLSGALTIEASGNNQIIFDGNSLSRIFEISTIDSDIILRGLTVRGGYATTGGGAIGNRGTLLLDNMYIHSSQADSGGGIANEGTLTITNSKISGNIAFGSDLEEEDSTGRGGAIHNMGTLTVVNTLFVENFADGVGGAIANEGQMTVTNSTIATNWTMSLGGAGIYTELETAAITELYNSIVAGNRVYALDACSDVFNNVFGSFNLIGDGSGQTWLADGIDGNLVGTANAPLDVWFADPDSGNFRLSENSPAVNHGSNSLAIGPDGAPLAVDLDGNTRIQGNTVDIGAYEYAVLDWGTVRINLRDWTDAKDVTWLDEWSGCWVEIWGRGDTSSGIGAFDVTVQFGSSWFTPDMSTLIAGEWVEGELTAVHTGPIGELQVGTLQISGTASDEFVGLGQESEVLLAKVYFKPTPGESTFARNSQQSYPQPVPESGFQIIGASLTQADASIAIEQDNLVPLWPVLYDLDGDSHIDLKDVLLFLPAFQMTTDESATPIVWGSDFNRSGKVDLEDLLPMLSFFQWEKGEGQSVSYPDDVTPEWWGPMLLIVGITPSPVPIFGSIFTGYTPVIPPTNTTTTEGSWLDLSGGTFSLSGGILNISSNIYSYTPTLNGCVLTTYWITNESSLNDALDTNDDVLIFYEGNEDLSLGEEEEEEIDSSLADELFGLNFDPFADEI